MLGLRAPTTVQTVAPPVVGNERSETTVEGPPSGAGSPPSPRGRSSTVAPPSPSSATGPTAGSSIPTWSRAKAVAVAAGSPKRASRPSCASIAAGLVKGQIPGKGRSAAATGEVVDVVAVVEVAGDEVDDMAVAPVGSGVEATAEGSRPASTSVPLPPAERPMARAVATRASPPSAPPWSRRRRRAARTPRWIPVHPSSSGS